MTVALMCTVPDGQVEHGVADGGGLAEVRAGAEHELHEVGQVEPGRCRVGGEAGLQVAASPGVRAACLTVAGAMGRESRTGLWRSRVAHGVGAQTGQRPGAAWGRLGSLGDAEEAGGRGR